MAGPQRRTPPRILTPINRVGGLAAGTRWWPVWGIVRHRGRRTGTAYETPVAVLPAPGRFYIGLPWGPSTDWVRNLKAAGGGTVVWKGRDYAVSEPTLVDRAEVLTNTHGPKRAILERLPLTGYLRLTRFPA